jgi:hypothetical protein
MRENKLPRTTAAQRRDRAASVLAMLIVTAIGGGVCVLFGQDFYFAAFWTAVGWTIASLTVVALGERL